MIALVTLKGVAYSENPYTAEEVRAGIVAAWPENLVAYAIRVANCETSMGQNPNTYNINLQHVGTFQFLSGTWRPYFERLGFDWVVIVYDPYWNAWAAYQVFLEQGASAWPNC